MTAPNGLKRWKKQQQKKKNNNNAQQNYTLPWPQVKSFFISHVQ